MVYRSWGIVEAQESKIPHSSFSLKMYKNIKDHTQYNYIFTLVYTIYSKSIKLSRYTDIF